MKLDGYKKWYRKHVLKLKDLPPRPSGPTLNIKSLDEIYGSIDNSEEHWADTVFTDIVHY